MINLPAFASAFLLTLLACVSSIAAEDAKTPPAETPPAKTEKDAPKTEKADAKKDPKDMSADELEAASLCPVKRIESKQIYHYELNGKTYHFCCRKCQAEFEEHPEKFGVKAEKEPEKK